MSISYLTRAHAVLVGTGTHGRGSVLPGIPAVERTVRELGQALVELCGLPADQLHLLIDPPNPMALRSVLGAVAEQAEDLFLFYYAGHGLIGSDGELYLASQATDDLVHGLATSALPYAEVRDALTFCRARSVIVILDCCFSGRAYGAFGTAVVDTFELSYVGGSFLLTSTAANEPALAPVGEPYTAFTGELLSLLRDGDPAGPRELTLEHTYQYLNRVLPRRGLPAPHRRAGDRVGELSLCTNPAAPPLLVRRTDGGHEEPTDQPCPYRGLDPFTTADVRYFFGREQVTADTLACLRDRAGDEGPIAVVGPSGAGKSSLLQAGLIPAVKQGRLEVPGSSDWPCLVCTPGENPLGTLAARLATPAGMSPEEIRDTVRADPSRFGEIVRRALRGQADGRDVAGRRLVLIVDQLEELFTECKDKDERDVFIHAVTTRSSPAIVVLGIRTDFYGHCLAYPALTAVLEDAQILVTNMTNEQSRDAIEQPAKAAGLAIEEGLTDLILHDLRTGDKSAPDASATLPLLSYALLVTWQQREGRTLTLAGYQAVGGIWRAVTQQADLAYHGLDDAGQRAAKELLLRMVRVGAGTEDTRRRINLEDLIRERTADGATAIARARDALAEARLITLDTNHAQITHEALLHAWPMLRTWLDTDRAGLLTHQQLTDAATDWDQEDRDPATLYRGARLITAADFATTSPHVHLSSLEQEFLDASLQLRDREQAATRRRTRMLVSLVTTLAILLVISVIAAVVAVDRTNEALEQSKIATSRALVTQADTLRGIQPRASLAFSLQALRTNPTPEARASLTTTLAQTNFAGVLSYGTGRIESMFNLAYSPDGQLLVVSGLDHVFLWEPPKQTPVAVLDAAMAMFAFSPDGNTLATVPYESDVVTLWNISDPAHPTQSATLTGSNPKTVTEKTFESRVVFTADGHRLIVVNDSFITSWDVSDSAHPVKLATVESAIVVAVSQDGRVVIIDYIHEVLVVDLSDPERPVTRGVLSPAPDSVISAAFSKDNRTLATVSLDSNHAVLWDISDQTKPRLLGTTPERESNLRGVAISPAADLLATTGTDDATVLWNLVDKSHPILHRQFPGFANEVGPVAFHPNGKMLSTADQGSVVRWNVRNRLPVKLTGIVNDSSPDGVSGVAFSADRRTLAFSWEKNAVLWNIRDPRHAVQRAIVPAGEAPVTTVALSSDGSTVAALDSAGTMILSDITTSQVTTVVKKSSDEERSQELWSASLALRPDGRVLAIADDREVTLWDITDRSRPVELASIKQDRLAGHRSLLFTPDGRTMITTVSYTETALWDVSNTRKPARLGTLTKDGGGPTIGMNELSLSADGRTLAAGGSFNTELFDLSDPAQPRHLGSVGDDQVVGSALSPDGKTLAMVAFNDGTTTLWDVSDPGHPVRLTDLESTDEVYDLAFSNDGRYLVTGGRGRTPLTLWDTSGLTRAVAHPEELACTLVGPIPGREDWERHLPGVPYDATMCTPG
jgi:WD40 repeat protein